MPWAKSFCPFRACCLKELLPLQGVLPTFSLRAASSLSFGRGDKAAESGDVDYEYHHIIKGLYATFSSWHTDPCRFPVKCGCIFVAEHLILLPSLGVKQSAFLWNLIITCNRLEVIIEEYSSIMFVATTIIFSKISSPTISTFGFATIHDFLVF